MKILVIDDHPLIQDALADALPALGDIEAIPATTRDETRVALARHPDCALALLDLTLPGARGLDLLAELRRDYPLLPILVLSATRDKPTVSAALAAGARGYVAKTADSAALLDAIRSVLDGARGITASIAPGRARCPEVGLDVLGLTQRQADVLELLVQGKPNKMICRDLRLSEGTVKVHVSAILKALNVHSRSQAIVELAKRGVVVDGVAARQ
jgi:DNA-binding NarL/FixJ family response regulator